MRREYDANVSGIFQREPNSVLLYNVITNLCLTNLQYEKIYNVVIYLFDIREHYLRVNKCYYLRFCGLVPVPQLLDCLLYLPLTLLYRFGSTKEQSILWKNHRKLGEFLVNEGWWTLGCVRDLEMVYYFVPYCWNITNDARWYASEADRLSNDIQFTRVDWWPTARHLLTSLALRVRDLCGGNG